MPVVPPTEIAHTLLGQHNIPRRTWRPTNHYKKVERGRGEVREEREERRERGEKEKIEEKEEIE